MASCILMVSQSLILQMANKKCVKSAAGKVSDRPRSQRYRDEHSKDPEYWAKRAIKKARGCPYARGDPLGTWQWSVAGRYYARNTTSPFQV